MNENTVIMQALKNEQTRMEVMRIIDKIRAVGGTDTILRLAGYILTAPTEPHIEKQSA